MAPAGPHGARGALGGAAPARRGHRAGAASSGCPATYAEADRAFHRAALALAGNEQLVRIAGDVHRRAQWPPAGSPSVRGRADLVADAHQHTALLDALIAGDLDVVRALVGDHFTVTS
ncbi:GntR-family transcriptional regulator [Streptomyces lividans 1326]|uniref:GntR-family transcriptional regulator n=1 Tax=Streptomyces lividans 1326 TaxID=1200984 RepID=A0A7U9HEZ6_STRLI|nr:GntR-family transcriptional regulator [Streptomyces lividans 1326]